jgi:YVTN family beta-propeller protein
MAQLRLFKPYALVLCALVLLHGCCNQDFITPTPIDYDFYEGATDLTSIINSCSPDANYSTEGATADRNAAFCWATSDPQYNRWFKFTAPASGQISVTIDVGGSKGTQQYTQLALWDTDGTTLIGCKAPLNQPDEDVTLRATGLQPGRVYYLSVDVPDEQSRGSFTCCLSDAAVPAQLRVFVSNANSDDVSVIDPASRTEIDVLTCETGSCNEPRNLAVSPNKLLVYVPYRHSNLVSIIDPETLATIADITDGSFDEPYAIAFTADSKEAWVVNKQGGGSSTGSITIINTITQSVIQSIDHPALSSPEGITIANGKAYVANRGDGNVPVFNVSNRSFITTINTPGSESRFAAATPDERFVYVGNGSDILKIETNGNTVLQVIPIPGFSRNLTVSPNGEKVFVATQSNSIYSINVADNAVTIISFGTAVSLYGVAVSSNTNLAFATDEWNNVVFVFDALTGSVINDPFGLPLQISVGTTPRAIAAQ